MIPPDVEQWLTRATRGMDSELAERIRDELLAHYEDACADYIADGKTPDEAHHAALSDLGDSGDVGQAFRRTHHAGRRYLFMAILGLCYPLLYLLSIPLNEWLTGGVMFNLALFLPLVYVVYGFKDWLSQQPDGLDLRRHENVIHVGIVVMCVPRLANWLIFHRPMITEAYASSIWDVASQIEVWLNLASLVGLCLAAAGFIALGERVLHLRDHFWLKSAAVTALVCGVCLLVYGISSFFGDGILSETAEILAVQSGMVATLIWSFIFFRARMNSIKIA